MSKTQQKRRNQAKEGRLVIVADLYRRGYSVRQIRQEVMKRLDLDTYAVSTCQSDIQTLLQEWRESRLSDTDDLLELELARIDDTVRELWEQWEKSKEDYVATSQTRKGAPVRQEENAQGQEQQQPRQEGNNIRTYSVERTEKNVIGLGNTAYIAEIRQQLQERRKLLGLYAPEKREMSGTLSFAALLEQSGAIDEAEREANGVN